MLPPRRSKAALALLAGLTLAAASLSGCGSNAAQAGPAADTKPAGLVTTAPATPAASSASASPSPSASPSSASPSAAPSTAAVLPSPGNPQGHATIPSAAEPVDTSHPTRVVGDGTAASCTSAAVVSAVAKGGLITFSCGPAPVVITMTATAKVVNSAQTVVLDGGGKVTLSGGGVRRILYMNTCDKAQTWTTSHCQNQQYPQLTLQNLTFTDGNSTGQAAYGGGGGAVFASGGRLKIVNDRFTRNRCDSTGPDLGGAAVRALEQWNNLPVYVVKSTFGGAAGLGGVCSNGGALSSIGVSWDVIDCVMTYNEAIGVGANPARSGTPGGGSGGAIYNDGNTYTLTITDSVIEHNQANEGGGAVFYVSNDRSGTMTVNGSTLHSNVSKGFYTAGYPGVFFLGQGKPVVSGSSLE
ncbi:hypothetical protein [Actinospica robiniae]|uniref:hypothetical protein n=1 Tax=Actinospica robiniae TaxID=304901 RepID=UPI00040F4E8C|nr:hypothetical protein [Actinospica robiniae]